MVFLYYAMNYLKFYDLCQTILYDARKCQNNATIKKYRKLILYLMLVANRFLPGYVIRQLLSFGYDDYNNHSADAYIKRLLDKGVLSSASKAYYGRYALYSLTPAGVDDMTGLLNTLYPNKVLAPHSPAHVNDKYLPLRKIYDSRRKDSPKPHATAEAISYALLFLSLPCGDIQDLVKEVQYDISKGNQLVQEKGKGNMVADLSFSYDTGVKRNVFYEVDLTTERMAGTNGIREKTAAYAALSNRLSDATYFSSLQLIFSIFDDGWVPRYTSSSQFSKKETFALAGNLYPYYFNISLAELALQLRDPGRNQTIGDMIALLREEGTLLNKNVFKEEGTQYDTLLTLLSATARAVSPYTDIPVSRIRSALDMTANLAAPDKELLIMERYQKLYQKRRSSIFQMVCSEFPADRPTNSIIGRAAARGMMLACCPGRYPDTILPYLMPELFFTKGIPRMLDNLGLTAKRGCPISNIYCLPLRGNAGKDSLGILYNDYDTYMRCTFRSGDLTCCIENVSDDIGGFIRSKEYLRLPPSFRPKTILIMLVNDDGILADGSHVDDCTLYYQEYQKEDAGYQLSNDGQPCVANRHFIHYENMNIVQLLKGYLTAYQNADREHADSRFLPYSLSRDQDFLMLTYSEFQSAMYDEVSPWIKIPDVQGTITVKRGPLPSECPPVPAAPVQYMADQRPPCNWDHLLSSTEPV